MFLALIHTPANRLTNQAVELVGDPRSVVRVMRNGKPASLLSIIRIDMLYGIDAETEREIDALASAIGDLTLRRFPAASHRTLIELVVTCILRSLHIKFTAKHINMGERFDLRWLGREQHIDPAIEWAITRLITTAVHTVTAPYESTVTVALRPPNSHIIVRT